MLRAPESRPADATRPTPAGNKSIYGNSIGRGCESTGGVLDGSPAWPYDEPNP